MHGRSRGDLLSSGGVDVEEVCLNERGIHTLGGPSGNDEVLFATETLLDPLSDVAASMAVLIGYVDASLDIVEPGEEVFGPKLECIEKFEVRPISESQLILAILDESFNSRIVVIEIRIGDELIDEVHLHCDFLVHGNVATNHGLTKLTVIHRNCTIG